MFGTVNMLDMKTAATETGSPVNQRRKPWSTRPLTAQTIANSRVNHRYVMVVLVSLYVVVQVLS